jgi:hypothetical protein
MRVWVPMYMWDEWVREQVWLGAIPWDYEAQPAVGFRVLAARDRKLNLWRSNNLPLPRELSPPPPPLSMPHPDRGDSSKECRFGDKCRYLQSGTCRFTHSRRRPDGPREAGDRARQRR